MEHCTHDTAQRCCCVGNVMIRDAGTSLTATMGAGADNLWNGTYSSSGSLNKSLAATGSASLQVDASRAAGHHTQHGTQHCFRNRIQHAVGALVFTRMIHAAKYAPAALHAILRKGDRAQGYYARWESIWLVGTTVISSSTK
jgi:hypothetical protein